MLVRRKKELVTKDELMREVWPDTFVEEANLSRNIFLLRKALGETPQDHQYVVTVPGRGYRFAEDVQLIPEPQLDIVAASHSTVQVQVKETRPWRWLIMSAVVLIAATVGAYKLFLHRAPVLTRRTRWCSQTSPTPPGTRCSMERCGRDSRYSSSSRPF